MENPVCANALTTMAVGRITVDACERSCGGIWFDRYELMRVDESHESAGFGGAVARFDESVYVEVRLSGGGGWGATLYTPEGVRAILVGWRRVGGEHSGLYFWAPGVTLIREPDLTVVPLEHDRDAP